MAIATRLAVIPSDYVDLVEQPVLGRLTTLMPDGYPQTHPVWFDVEGACLRINTMRQFRKTRNMARDPRVTLLVVDPADTNRWMEIRGVVTLTEEGAAGHLDRLARRYAGVEHFFGGSIPAEFAGRETPVIGRITPLRIVTIEMATSQCLSDRPPRRGPLPGRVVAPEPRAELPGSHRDLLERPVVAALSTLLPGGHPQTQPVWFEVDGDDVLVNSTRERRKVRNLEVDPRACLLVVDPDDTSRWVEIRGDVGLATEGAVDHVDRLTRLYTGHPQYYGWIRGEEYRDRETRVVCRLRPRHIVCDAVHYHDH